METLKDLTIAEAIVASDILGKRAGHTVSTFVKFWDGICKSSHLCYPWNQDMAKKPSKVLLWLGRKLSIEEKDRTEFRSGLLHMFEIG